MIDQVELAYELAVTYHKGQVDKNNEPYINHVFYVASLSKNDNEFIVALLHDIVEDTPITLEDLKAKGFQNHIIEAVDAITKREGEDYKEYLNRVLENRLATIVKINDLNHNGQIERYKNPTLEDLKRCYEYKAKQIFLEEKYYKNLS